MFTTTVISLRETFETALILCVLLSYFSRKKEDRAMFWMWLGTGCGIVWSVAIAVMLILLQSWLSEELAEMYEGTMMIIAAGLLSWMIVWMASHGSTMKESLEQNVARHMSTGYLVGVALTSFLATAREGTELVILTHAALLTSTSPVLSLMGSGFGILIAVVLGWFLYQGSKRLPINAFFILTSTMLIVIAVLLLEHGIHEFVETHVLPEHILIERGIPALFGLLLIGYWLRTFRRR